MDNINQAEFEAHLKKAIEVIVSDDRGIMSLMKPEFVSADAENKTFTISYKVEKWELNPQGVMHGGMITTALDNAFGVLTHSFSNNHFVTTIEMSEHFLKPIFEGDIVLVTVRAVNVGKTIVTLEGECRIKNKDNMLAATAVTTYMILKNITSTIENDENGEHVKKEK